MSVVIETTIGDLTVDLYTRERPRTAMNFLKLCKMKYYNFQLFFKVAPNFVCQAGDPSFSGRGGESIFSHLYGEQARFFEAETEPRLKHLKLGTLSMVDNGEGMLGSQFLITLSDGLDYLDERHCVFGEVVEGMDFLERINEVICDKDERPLQDIMITHTVVLEDPFPEPELEYPPSPEVTLERLKSDRIGCYENIDDYQGRTAEEIEEALKEKEAKAQATMLEIIGDLPDADMAPPENVLFVCKLNPVTNDDDLELIFSRFGEIKSCEIIRDWKTGESLQYAFIEFAEKESCEQAYFKMDNVLIDDRRIHVDFSQSVAKVKWKGKGRGVVGSWSENEKKNMKFDDRPRDKFVIRDNRKKDGYQLILGGDSHSREPQKSSQERRKSRSPNTRRNYRRRSPSPEKRKENSSKRERRRSPSPRNRRTSPSPRARGRSPSPRSRRRSPSPKHRRDKDRRSRSREKHQHSKSRRSTSRSRHEVDKKRSRDDYTGKHRSRSRDRERTKRTENTSKRRSRSRDYRSDKRR